MRKREKDKSVGARKVWGFHDTVCSIVTVCQGADLDITDLFQHDDKTALSTVSHIAQSVKMLCVWKIGLCVLVCVLVGKTERDRRLWKARVCVCVCVCDLLWISS